jgi:hypothetical protein
VSALLVAASCANDAGSSTTSASNPIMVGMHLHVDPVGVGTPLVKDPTRDQRIAEYESHRESMAWLRQLCQDKGCKISAQMTGVYAEFVTKLAHFDDFKDFMPGGTHHLGVHLHGHYKDPEANQEDFTWSETPAGTSSEATRVWNDEVPLVNEIFEHFGFPATANDEWDGAQAMCQDMMTCLGHRSGAAYPNKFTIVGGSRENYHPHRSNPADPPLTQDTLANGPCVAVSLGIEGVFGVNGEHGPDGWVNGSLEFAQRDYVMEYVEWLYSKTWDSTSRPWVFEVSFHPYNVLAKATDPQGRPVRDTLASLYDWLNQEFSDTLTYANRAEVVAAYQRWEGQNPGEPIFVDSDPSTSTIEPRMFNASMRSTLKTNAMYLTASNRTSDPEIFEFANQAGNKAVLAVAKAQGARLDLGRYFTGSVSRIRMGEKASAMNLAPETVELDRVPVMFTDATASGPSDPQTTKPTDPQAGGGSCGDGTCDGFERQSGMCPTDCH